MPITIKVTDKHEIPLLKTGCKLDSPSSCRNGYACPVYELLMTGPHAWAIGMFVRIYEDDPDEYTCHISSMVRDTGYIDKAELVINQICYACEHRIPQETNPGDPGQFEQQIYPIVNHAAKRIDIPHPSKDECPAVLAERGGKTPSEVIAACNKCRLKLFTKMQPKEL